jgi:uncharacterized protein
MNNPCTPTQECSQAALPGIPARSASKLPNVLTGQSQLEAIRLFGSRAMGYQQPSFDIDLMRLMNAVDDQWLPWRVDLLLLLHQLDVEVRAHEHRVGRPIFKRQ